MFKFSRFHSFHVFTLWRFHVILISFCVIYMISNLHGFPFLISRPYKQGCTKTDSQARYFAMFKFPRFHVFKFSRFHDLKFSRRPDFILCHLHDLKFARLPFFWLPGYIKNDKQKQICKQHMNKQLFWFTHFQGFNNEM